MTVNIPTNSRLNYIYGVFEFTLELSLSKMKRKNMQEDALNDTMRNGELRGEIL